MHRMKLAGKASPPLQALLCEGEKSASPTPAPLRCTLCKQSTDTGHTRRTWGHYTKRQKSYPQLLTARLFLTPRSMTPTASSAFAHRKAPTSHHGPKRTTRSAEV